MCYSAQIEADYDKFVREFGAIISIKRFVEPPPRAGFVIRIAVRYSLRSRAAVNHQSPGNVGHAAPLSRAFPPAPVDAKPRFI